MNHLVLWLVLLIAAPAAAQPTMAVWVDDEGTLTNTYEVPFGLQFDVVVTLDSDGNESSYAEWMMPDLVAQAGLVKRGFTSAVGDCGLLPENCFQGEYRISFYKCEDASARLELGRISFADLTGNSPADFVVLLTGLGPEPGGDPEFLDCDEVVLSAAMGGSRGGKTSSGVSFPDGSLILNPTLPLPAEGGSFSILKSRY